MKKYKKASHIYTTIISPHSTRYCTVTFMLSQFCKATPKCELHAHLNGSIRETTLAELLEVHSGAQTSRIALALTTTLKLNVKTTKYLNNLEQSKKKIRVQQKNPKLTITTIILFVLLFFVLGFCFRHPSTAIAVFDLLSLHLIRPNISPDVRRR